MTGRDGVIFVFGSNLAGIHGAGSAREAYKNWGAVWGQGIGRQGRAYAIPTKDLNIRNILPLEVIQPFVDGFKAYARKHPELEFRVVKIGCGLAGYTPAQIAPMFRDSPDNVHLHHDFNLILGRTVGLH